MAALLRVKGEPSTATLPGSLYAGLVGPFMAREKRFLPWRTPPAVRAEDVTPGAAEHARPAVAKADLMVAARGTNASNTVTALPFIERKFSFLAMTASSLQ